MAYPDTIIIEGRGFSWRQICELRRQQIEQVQAAQAKQLALFEAKTDSRPAAGRRAAGRYQEPSLLSWTGQARRIHHLTAGTDLLAIPRSAPVGAKPSVCGNLRHVADEACCLLELTRGRLICPP